MLARVASRGNARGIILARVTIPPEISLKRTLIVLAALVLGLALLAPGIVGVLAQERHERQIEMTMRGSRHVELTAEEFERGWFSSRGRYRIELSDPLQRAISTDAADELPVLTIDSRLHHGPFALAAALGEGGTLMPVLGTVESQLALNSGEEAIFELPGSVITHIHFDGGGTARYASGALELAGQDGPVRWGGADIEVGFDAGATHIEAEGRIGALSFEDGEGSFESAAVSFSAEQALTEHGFWTGNSALNVPLVTWAGAEGGRFLLAGLRMRYAVTMPQAFVVATAEARLDELRTARWAGGPAVMRFALTHLEPEALGRLTAALQDVSAGVPADRPPGMRMSHASDELVALLARGAVITLEKLEARTPEGTVSAKLHLEFPESADARNVLLLVGGLNGTLSLQLPVTLVAQAGAADPQSRQYLQTLLETGFILERGGDYIVDAAYRGGLLTVNGIPVPIPFGAPPQTTP